MILPSKYLSPDRALLTIGGEVLSAIGDGGAVSDVWARFKEARTRSGRDQVAFDWFLLALSLTYAIGAVDFSEDRLRIVRNVP